jgi:two-component system, NtrC family, sensor kinase
MAEFYRIPALVLLCMLLVAFALLYLQTRTTRRLLWLIGWSMAVLRLAMEVAKMRSPGVGLALSNVGLVLASLMFLGSMSPLGFRRWPRILYAYVFAIPTVLFAVLISFYPSPGTALRVVLMLCTVAVVYVGVLWNARKNLVPAWFTLPFSILAGCAGLWLTYTGEYFFVLYLVQACTNLMTGLLFAAAFRRFSPGVIFASASFLLWTAPIILNFVFLHPGPTALLVGRGVNLIKVMAAFGMILIALEDEIAQNKAAKERDHRARKEMERYSEIDLSLLSGVNGEAAYQRACEVIIEASRFRQAALFLRNVENRFYVVAHAGMDEALVSALDALGKRVTSEQAERFRRSENTSVELGNTLQVDLRALFTPNDPLEQLQYFKSHVIPMRMRTGPPEGALFLSGLKQAEPLQADDLLPLELLVARMAAMREHTSLMQRVARSEKLASLGQLTAGVAHELNNPLTVVLGYSQILEDSLEGHPERRNASLIRSEAQRMRQIIESMMRFWKPSPIEHVPVSITEILRDIYRLRRAEFNQKQIELQLHLADDLLEIDGNRNQLQQMFLQLVNNSLDVFENIAATDNKMLRIDASRDENGVRVLISDNGHGFADPNRVFDPFFSTRSPRNGAGKGLSVCYAIVHDHGGEITAHNLQPHGAALVIQLPLRRQRRETALSDEALAQ